MLLGRSCCGVSPQGDVDGTSWVTSSGFATGGERGSALEGATDGTSLRKVYGGLARCSDEEDLRRASLTINLDHSR